ncbi:MAG TPA: polysaccharide deacetylase [Dehalococcoidia bacterium]|nr:polysaccharide deacetylase [Dehalococcoidia bacterium]
MRDKATNPGIWPGGARCAVMLTFDFDAESGWLSRDPSVADRPGILSQGTYGAKVGVPRILDLLDQQGIRSSFFIPGWVAERHPAPTRAICDAGHEIGHHGYLHERARPDQPEVEREAFARGLQALEAVAGVRAVGFRSPGWDLTPITLDLVRGAGMIYSSNLMDDAWPYLHRHPAGDVVELPVQWLLDDAPFFQFNPHLVNRPIAVPNLVYGQWQEELLGAIELGGIFNLTMHPQLTGHPSRLRMLRRLIELIKGLDGVWLATCEEVARFWLERERTRDGAAAGVPATGTPAS